MLKCASCGVYLLEIPIQCSCGDRLCYQCFFSLSNERRTFVCPQCGDAVRVSECFKDKAFMSELKKASLSCPNDGCSWEGSAEDYKIHLDTCCPPPESLHGFDVNTFGHQQECGAQKLHTEGYAVADKCGKDDSQDSVGGDESDSHKQQVKESLQLQLKNDVREDCMFSAIGCRYRGQTKNLEEHYDSHVKQHMLLLWKHLLSLEKELEVKLTQMAQQISDLKSEINHVHREISVKLQPVAAAMGKAETAIQNLQEGFSELALMVQTLQATSYNGTFIWKIPEIQRRRHEAKIGKTISLYSAPFYTCRQGYKACLRLYMDGDGCGKTTHLSFFLTLMKGEYDALLQWPFRHTVTLTLLDQDGAKNIAQSFKPEPTSSSFQRPKNEMNIASGCPMFAPLSVLNNSSYVKDDTMFLKCQIATK